MSLLNFDSVVNQSTNNRGKKDDEKNHEKIERVHDENNQSQEDFWLMGMGTKYSPSSFSKSRLS
jgi:hypothetical protein